MEAVGLAAGVVGFASLAIQLTDSAIKLQNQYQTYREAPAEVKSLIEELKLLSSLLDRINSTSSISQPAIINKQLLENCKSWCAFIKDSLSDVVNALSNEVKCGRRRALVKLVLKKESIQQWLAKLERAKGMLQLCNSVCSSDASQLRFEELLVMSNLLQVQQNLTTETIIQIRTQTNTMALDQRQAFAVQQEEVLRLNHRMHSMERELSAMSQQVQRICSTKVIYELDSKAEKTTYSLTAPKGPLSWQYTLRVKLPLWLCRKQWELQVTRATSGWMMSSFKPLVILPYNAELWRWCRNGDLDSTRDSLACHPGYLHSQTESGQTMLHLAATSCNIDLIQFLLEHGLDPLHMDSCGLLPMDYFLLRVADAETQRHDRKLATQYFFERFKTYDVIDNETRFGPFYMAWFVGIESLNEEHTMRALGYMVSMAARGTLPMMSPENGACKSLPDFLEDTRNKTPSALTAEWQGWDMVLCIAGYWLVRPALMGVTVNTSCRDTMSRAIQAGLSTTQENDRSDTLEEVNPWRSTLGFGLLGCLNANVKPDRSTYHANAALKFWVTLLAEEGVDLAAYAVEELPIYRNALRYSAERYWLSHNTSRHRFASWLAHMPLLSHGPQVSDWRFWDRHPGDIFSGDFWRYLERPVSADEIAHRIIMLKRTVEDVTNSLPGSWKDHYSETYRPSRCVCELVQKISQLDDEDFEWMLDLLDNIDLDAEPKYRALNLDVWDLIGSDVYEDRSRDDYIHYHWMKSEREPTLISGQWEDFVSETWCWHWRRD